MRKKRFGASAVSDGHFIYVIGGMDEKDNFLTSIEKFDPETGQSSEFAQLQTARLWPQAVFYSGNIYVLGGSVLALKTFMPPAQNPSRGASENQFQDRIMGGSTAQIAISMEHLEPEASMEVVDLATKHVSRGPAMPEGRTQFGCVVLEDELLVIGGKRIHHLGLSATNTTLCYSFTNGKWQKGIPPMPHPRMAQAVVVDGPFIVVPGGYDGAMAVNQMEAFDVRDPKWISLPPLCRACSAYSLAFLGHYLFLFGDYEAPAELIAYDLKTKTSQTFTLQYIAARNTAAVVLAGKIYIFGGKPDKDSAGTIDDIQVFVPPLHPNERR
ncbi:MAG TPA: kelch repeat-containing protein [Lacunisphaera sp.]